MERFPILFVAIGVCFSCLLCFADEYVESKSPDGKFALHVTRGDKQPFPQSDALIERATKKVVLDLDKDALFAPEAKLVWSGDSQRFAYVRETNEDPQSVSTRVFQRNGASFDEIKLPDLPLPKLPSQASPSELRRVYIKAIRWPDANSLELNYEIITDSGWRGAETISLKFDRQSSPTIVKTEAEPVSIVDYFLLLPDDALETRPRHWMHNATIVDKKNGYMSVSGDGAQPSFEVALFRYRDGRPLLALCQADLESDDPRCVSVEFFDLGADGKMQKTDRKIFPVRDQWDSGEQNKKYEDFRFILPRQGRTVLVRSARTKKILHKVTWNGEKFVEQRDPATPLTEMRLLLFCATSVVVALVLVGCGEPERAKPAAIRAQPFHGAGDFDEVGTVTFYPGESCASQIMFVFHGGRSTSTSMAAPFHVSKILNDAAHQHKTVHVIGKWRHGKTADCIYVEATEAEARKSFW